MGWDGPHALNLNLTLAGRGGEGRGQVLGAAGNGKAKCHNTRPPPFTPPSPAWRQMEMGWESTVPLSKDSMREGGGHFSVLGIQS